MDPIIDDEFNGLIPDSRSEEAYNQLEENTIKEKEPEKSIVLPTWDGILIDEYTLYGICQKHNIKFKNDEKKFTDRDEAKVWVLNHHIAMPTYPAFLITELVSKRDDILRGKEQGKQRMVEASHPKKNTDDAFQNSEKQPALKIETVNVTKKIAKEINSSTDTVSRCIYIIKNAPEAVKQKLRRGDITINEGYLNQKKHEREVEQIKNEGANESELQKIMRELEKDVRTKRVSTKIRTNFFKDIPLINHEDLKLIKVRVDQEVSNFNQTQVSTTTELPQAPAPTPLTVTETDSETQE